MKVNRKGKVKRQLSLYSFILFLFLFPEGKKQNGDPSANLTITTMRTSSETTFSQGQALTIKQGGTGATTTRGYIIEQRQTKYSISEWVSD
jgi:hypothetical protein